MVAVPDGRNAFSPTGLYRIVEPFLCWLLSLPIYLWVSHALGIWIALASLFMCIYETAAYQRMINRWLDTLDGLCESEIQAQDVKRFQSGQTAAKLPLQETNGIPTGLAPDIRRNMAIRLAEAKAAEGE